MEIIYTKKFKGTVDARDIHLGVSLHTVFRTMRQDEVIKGMIMDKSLGLYEPLCTFQYVLNFPSEMFITHLLYY
jgi:hypothetical protein